MNTPGVPDHGDHPSGSGGEVLVEEGEVLEFILEVFVFGQKVGFLESDNIGFLSQLSDVRKYEIPSG